ncbi:MAG TPA: hypothetical protein VMT16_09365 [Thermoanaerobaculia bacterium]|nr:hypothetical protein [Thermoanaerobaculia bacterium]
MSCPDWPALVALREGAGEDPAGWGEALDHLDRCGACWQTASAADPLLLFRRLPTPAAGEEVEPMRQRVHTLRRSRRLGGGRGARGWLRWPAAAAVLALFAVGGHGPTPQQTPPTAAPRLPSTLALLTAELAAQPVLEHLEHPYEQVLQWSEDDLSLVLVVDARLDV